VFLVVSFATPRPDYQKISGLTFSTMSVEDKAATRSTWSAKDVILSVLLVLAIIAIYSYFTG
jgi:SSS family solute:Na+ symporter